MGPEVAAGATAAGGAAGAGSILTPEIAAALLAGGTAAQMAAARDQAKQQRGILNRAYDRNDKTVADATEQTIGEATRSMTPEAQAAAIKTAQDASAARAMSDVRGAGANLIDTSAGGGAVSDDFARRKGIAQAGEDARLSQISQELGRVRAPGEVQQAQTMRRASLAQQLGSTFSQNRGRAEAAQLDARDVDSPWYGDVGKIASLVGGIGLGAGGSEEVAGSGALEVPEGMTAAEAAMWEANAGAFAPGVTHTAGQGAGSSWMSQLGRRRQNQHGGVR